MWKTARFADVRVSPRIRIHYAICFGRERTYLHWFVEFCAQKSCYAYCAMCRLFRLISVLRQIQVFELWSFRCDQLRKSTICWACIVRVVRIVYFSFYSNLFHAFPNATVQQQMAMRNSSSFDTQNKANLLYAFLKNRTVHSAASPFIRIFIPFDIKKHSQCDAAELINMVRGQQNLENS